MISSAPEASQSFQRTDEQIFSIISHSQIKTTRKTVLYPTIYL